MDLFFTADLHFDHDKIGRYAQRPFATTEAMNDALIENWNSLIGKKDLVYILGDFAFRRHEHFQQALNGRKILIRGSHDEMSKKVLDKFEGVYDIKKIKVEEQKIVLSHCAFRVWEGYSHGSWNFYGHSHGNLPENEYHRACDVGVDVWNYYPVPWEVLKAKMKTKSQITFRTKEEVIEARIELIRRNSELFKAWKK